MAASPIAVFGVTVEVGSGVTPEHIRHDVILRCHRLDRLLDFGELTRVLEVARNSSVEAKKATVHHRSNRQISEALAETLEDPFVVLFFAFLLEAVASRELLALVVSAQQVNLVRIEDLERKEKQEDFDRVRSSVNIVTQEDITRFRRVADPLEYADKRVDVAMNVTHNRKTALKVEENGLILKQIETLSVERANFPPCRQEAQLVCEISVSTLEK